ncbi:MAG: hypothetical protein HY646_00350 [Acidobacteria bacterium]|nr:hypothetical protein [Acidobacteriota bacterium]
MPSAIFGARHYWPQPLCPQQPRTSLAPIIGVVADDVVFPPTVPSLRDPGHGLNDSIDYWAPIDLNAARRPAGRQLEAIAKLKHGVSAAQAQAEMERIARDLEQRFPETNKGWTIRVVPIDEELFGDVRPALVLLMGAFSVCSSRSRRGTFQE